MYNFLGNYNVFKAIKDSEGKISILTKESSNLIQPQKWYHKHKIVSTLVNLFKPSASNVNAEYFEVFVRPHDMEITKKPTKDGYIAANISYINIAGPVVKLELESPHYEIIQVELSQENYEQLALKEGEQIFTKARQITMFAV